MTEDQIEDIAIKLYHHDHDLGFCGHDISGEAMARIVQFIANEILLDLEMAFSKISQASYYTPEQVKKNLRSLLYCGS